MEETTPKTRAIKPDAQGFDRIEIVTVPRYKTSGLSGDEWRISATIIFYRKGLEVHREEGCGRNIKMAASFLPFMVEKAEDTKAYYAGEGNICDQEGCEDQAEWRHELKHKFCREGHKTKARGEYRLFCNRHRVRGDCGLEDADSNYIVSQHLPTRRM